MICFGLMMAWLLRTLESLYFAGGIKIVFYFNTKFREESTNLLTEEIESELNKFQDVLLIEKKVREETQSKIYRMVEDIHGKL